MGNKNSRLQCDSLFHRCGRDRKDETSKDQKQTLSGWFVLKTHKRTWTWNIDGELENDDNYCNNII